MTQDISKVVRKAISAIGTALVSRDRAEQGAKARFNEALRRTFEMLRTSFEAAEVPKDKGGLSQMRRALREAEKSDAGQVLTSVLKSGACSDLAPKTWSNYKTGLFKAYICGVNWTPKISDELSFPWGEDAPKKKGNTSTTKGVATEETKAGETTTLTKESVAVALATDLERLALLGEREAKLAKTLEGLLKAAEILK